MSSHFPTSASLLARVRADGPPSVRERRIAGDTESERSSSNRALNGQHLAVLHFVKQCLPTLFGKSPAEMPLRVVGDSVVVQRDDGVERVYQDCILEVVANGLENSELELLCRATRSIVLQLCSDPQSQSPMLDNVAQGFVRQRLGAAFAPEINSVDAALLVLLGRPITCSFNLKVPGLDDLPMSGDFLSAPEYAGPATEQVFKGRVGGGSFLTKKKRELQLLVDAPTGAKKKYETVVIEYNPPQHRLVVHPQLLEPEQVVYLKVKSSKVRRANGTSSNLYELIEVLTAAEADVVARGVADPAGPAGSVVSWPSRSQSAATGTCAVSQSVPC